MNNSAERKKRQAELLGDWKTFRGDQRRLDALKEIQHLLGQGKHLAMIYSTVVFNPMASEIPWAPQPPRTLTPLEWNVAKAKNWLDSGTLTKLLEANS